jgi:hypothetical protein
VIAENNYLEVGDELGVLPMILFVALTVVLLLHLRRIARRRSDPLFAAVWAGGLGIAVSAWFLQTWSDFAVAWTFWGLAGAAFSVARERAGAPEEARQTPARVPAPVLQRPSPSASR